MSDAEAPLFRVAAVCADLEEPVDRVVSLGRDVYELGVREVVLVHVVDAFGDRSRIGPPGPEADRAFSDQIAALESLGLKVRVDVPVGHVSYSLEDVSDRFGADLVAVSGRGLDALGSASDRAVSSDIARVSTRPVLASVGRRREGSILDRVLFPTDFSEAATTARGCLEQSMRWGSRSVHLLHVQDIARLGTAPGILREYDTTDTLRLEKRRQRLLDLGAREVTTSIVHGDPAAEVAMAAASGGYSLVMMGSRGRSQTTDRFLGAVSAGVVARAACPVLLASPRSEG